jgi:DNA-binding beta-propeller fold protein YncE
MQLWKVPFKGGAAVQATTHTGVYATESDDGRSLYYFGLDSLGSHSILRKPLNGGEESRVLVSSSLDWFAWALTHEGIYFVDRGGLVEEEPREFQEFKGKIEYMEFATGEITPIFSLEQPSSQWGGVTVSPDGKALYWGQIDRDDSYIMLVKNFR